MRVAAPLLAVGLAFAPAIGATAAAALSLARGAGEPGRRSAGRDMRRYVTTGVLVTQVVLLAPVVLWLDRMGWPARSLVPSVTGDGTVGAAVSTVLLLALVGLVARAFQAGSWAAPAPNRPVTEARPGAPMVRGFPFPTESRYLPLALGCGLVTAVYEELVFRGALQLSLAADYGVGVGVAGSTSLFAVAHAMYGASRALFALIVGLAFGCTFAYTGDLGPVVVTHAVHNIVAVVRVSAGRRPVQAP